MRARYVPDRTVNQEDSRSPTDVADLCKRWSPTPYPKPSKLVMRVRFPSPVPARELNIFERFQDSRLRRQIGESLHDLQEAERVTPEQTRTHTVARAVARDLLQLSGLRPRPELRELAERFGVLP